MLVRKAIDVSGIVQGVGFRPHVYRLALERSLAGTICNTAAGVTIEVQGENGLVADFIVHVSADAPPLARVTEVQVRDLPCNGDRAFRIVESRRGEAVHTLISPDVATCPDCLRELLDPNDRRYRYPFINCTNCGPRFTIVRNIPYDRPYTSMAVFPMCPACRAEYENPLDRRFHAQPNACWDCGPRLELRDASGERRETADPLSDTIRLLQEGRIVAIKGLGGFHLAVNAADAAAVQRLRERKRRVEKPFAVMVPDVAAAEWFCEADEASRALLQRPQRPIMLLPRRREAAIAAAVAPGNGDLGIFLPYTPVHQLLFHDGGLSALVMTSANLSEEPIVIGNEEAVTRLRGIADAFLMHNRDVLLRCDDSVLRVLDGKPRHLRRSRGFVPTPVFLGAEQPPVLAVGGELKNTICLTRGRHAFLSQHIGDLENLESYAFFEEAIEHLQRILEIEPRVIAHDLHPDYFSTRWALGQSLPAIGVQHHHAHIASCMAENGLDGKVIGIALDGAGYGSDGRIWGGEVLVADTLDFERIAHLGYVPMPGGAAAVREPWRMAVAHLAQAFGPAFLELEIPFLSRIRAKNAGVLLRAMDRGVNSPLTSSCGRLFDAVAALLGVRTEVNYEAQAAIELEMQARDSADESSYGMELIEAEVAAPSASSDPYGKSEPAAAIIDARRLFCEIVHDLERGTDPAHISRRFHRALANALGDAAVLARQRFDLHRVCLSGGTFQNALLFSFLQARLASLGFEIFSHAEVPSGDGGLSLGQAVIGARRLAMTR